MAKGLQKHQERQEALGRLGRGLARRARSRCELCEASGVRLDPLEVPPLGEEPELERTIMCCQRCAQGVEGGSADAGQWRFLEGVVWSEVPAVQVCAVRMLRRFSGEGASWAQDVLDGLYLEAEIQAWVDGVAPE